MRRALLASIALCLVTGNLATAQPVTDGPGGTAAFADTTFEPRPFWAQGEYLLWWTKNAPLPAPLVTTGDAIDPDAGTIGLDSTRVILGGQNLDFGPNSGARFAIGAWLDGAGSIGFEASGFVLERRSRNFLFDGFENPLVLAVPFFNTLTQQEDSIFISEDCGCLLGAIDLRMTSRLWGAEANFLGNVYRDPGWDFNVTTGFRYLDLAETLQYDVNSDIGIAQDTFDAHNQFYGWQVGVQAERRYGAAFVSFAGKLAFGGTHQQSTVFGSTNIPLIFENFPDNGIFALPSNSGTFDRDGFAVVPEVRIQAGYQLTRGLCVFAGYTFLYWSNVVRPGDQLDRNLDPRMIPFALADFIPGFVGTQPQPQLNRTDFWAQGLNLGAELRF